MPVEPNPSPAAPPSPAPEPGPAAPAAPSPSAPVRPEGLPDHFWDQTAGVRTNELIASYNDLATAEAKRAEVFKEFPKDAAKASEFYKLPEQMLPEGVKLPDGVQFKPNTDLLNAALPVLYAHKVDPATFQDLTRAFNAYELGRYTKAEADMAEDNKKLGDNADARRADLAKRLDAAVPGQKFLDAKIISAAAVEFFEALLKDGNVVPLNRAPGGAPAPEPKPLLERWYGAQQQRAS